MGERELTPTTRPRTKAEALEMALKWGTEWSHHNEYYGMSDPAEDGMRLRNAGVLTAQHDAAEVQRLAALHSMLPDQAEGKGSK